MALSGSYRIKRIGFRIGSSSSTLRVLAASRVRYRAVEEAETWKVGAGEHERFLDHLHLRFSLRAGVLYQQENTSSFVTLSDGTTIDPAALLTPSSLLNALNDDDVFFLPMLDNGAGNVDLGTFYQVIRDSDNQDLLDGNYAGFLDAGMSFDLITKEPLFTYPSWINP